MFIRAKLVLLAVVVAGLAHTPTSAAAPGDFGSPIFGISTAPDDSRLVADFDRGIVKVGPSGASLCARLPGVVDLAPMGQ